MAEKPSKPVREPSDKPIFVELGIEFVFELLLFLYPYGAEQMNLAHNFWLGLGCWIAGTAIAVRMFWIFPAWRSRLSPLEKWLSSFIFVGLFVWAIHNPVVEAYKRRNGEPKPETVAQQLVGSSRSLEKGQVQGEQQQQAGPAPAVAPSSQTTQQSTNSKRRTSTRKSDQTPPAPPPQTLLAAKLAALSQCAGSGICVTNGAKIKDSNIHDNTVNYAPGGFATSGGTLINPQIINNFASSAEFVGGLRFGESSKRVKQGHFHGFIGSKAEGSSGNHSYLVVETLDGAA